MNSKFPYYINQGLLKSAGRKLTWIGSLLVFSLVLGFILLVPDIFKKIDEVLDLSYGTRIKLLASIPILITAAAGISAVLFILAGRDLIRSTDGTKANEFDMIPPVTETDDNGNTLTKYYYPNGTLKKIESFNRENKKNGWWEYYSPSNGKLQYKEFYENGDYKNLFRPE